MAEPAVVWTRRLTLTALGAAAATGAASAAAGTLQATKLQSLDKAVEALRGAMVSGDRVALDHLLHDRLVYMHSSGHGQTKANLMADLAGKAFFASLGFPEKALDLQGTTGLAVLTVDQVKNLPNGQTRASRIKVIQTWAWTDHRWQLFARFSAILSSPLTPACKPEAGS